MSQAGDPSRQPFAATRVSGWSRRIEVGLLSTIFAGVVGVGLAQIVLRNFADASLVWADAAMRAGVLWITMLAAVLAAGQMRHIRIDVLLHRLPDAVQPWVRRLLFLLTAMVCVTLAVAGVGLIRLERSMGDVAFLGVPRWMVLVIIPVGFALMGWRFARHALGPATPDDEPGAT